MRGGAGGRGRQNRKSGGLRVKFVKGVTIDAMFERGSFLCAFMDVSWSC